MSRRTWLLLFLLGLLAAPALGATVKLGVEVLLEKRLDLLAGKRVGLITNASAVDHDLVTTLDRLRAVRGLRLVQLYAPEHGIESAKGNGKSDHGTVEPVSGLPVEGIVGREPSPRSLRRLDVLVFDIQDIGSRTYTYISTLGLAMTAAARAGVTVVVLDRPNPLGGRSFEGPIRAAKYKSFIGWGPIPVTHGMTVGELARFYNQELGLGCKLVVVPMEGWRRDMTWRDTGLTWVPTSPGIPHETNAQLYVATGMIGGAGTTLNEGIGTAMPFELIGAPWIDPRRFAEAMNQKALPGVRFRPHTYTPRSGRYEDKPIAGVQLMLDDPAKLRPLRTALTILVTLRDLYPRDFVVKKAGLFRYVWGSDTALKLLRAGKSVAEIEASWADSLARFGQARAKVLLYE